MSTIMRRIFAEAQAARAAASDRSVGGAGLAHATGPTAPAMTLSMVGCWSLPLTEPAATARSTAEWWTTRIAHAARAR